MKRTWIKVRRGLLEPKHREKLGARIWLYLYMLDLADWKTGRIEGWKDTEAAADLGMPHRTLQDQRQRLAEDGYISSAQSFQSLSITIHNWINPREYSGEVYNRPESEADNSSWYGEFRTHGTESSVPIHTESSVPLHTVTQNHTKESHKKSKARKRAPRDERLDHPAVMAYREIAHRTAPAALRDDLCAVQDAERFKGIVKMWIGKGWNPGNISGMLDVYHNGEKSKPSRNGKTTAPVQTADEYEAERLKRIEAAQAAMRGEA